MTTQRTTDRARGERDFRLLWSGQAVSSLGSHTADLALTLVTLAVTGSPAMAGVLGFVAGLPMLLLQLPAGALVDRWDRRRVMLRCDAGRMVLVASIPAVGLLGGLSFGWLVVVAVGNATLDVMFLLAQSATLPRLVSPERLPRAISRTQAGAQGAALAGQPLGGWLYGLAPLLPFVVDAVSFAVSWLSIALIRTDLVADRSGTSAPATTTPLRGLHREIGDGLRYLWRQPMLRTLALLTAAVTLACAGFTLAVVVRLTGEGASPGAIGVVFGCCGAAGLAGAAVTPRLIDRLGPRACFLTGLAVSATLTILIAVADRPVLVGLCAGGIVAVGPLSSVVLQVARANSIPAHLFARVRAAEITVAASTAPLSSLLTGLALTRVGPSVTCAVIGGLLAVVTVVAAGHPGLRQIYDPTPEGTAGSPGS